MNRWGMLWEIARWELLRWLKIKDLIRTLVISSVLGLVIWGGLALVNRYDGGAIRIAVLNPDTLPFELPARTGLEIEDSSSSSEEEAFQKLEAREIDAVLRLESADVAELVVTREPLWKGSLEQALSAARRQLKLQESGLDAGQLADLVAPIELETVYHSTADPPSTFEGKVAAGLLVGLTMLGVFTGIAYQFIVITGEKQLRVTEQVVSAISPQMWIDGKILGISLLAFCISATYVVSGLIFVMLSRVFGIGVGIPLRIGEPGLWIGLSLLAVGGFLMWNTFFGLVAATIDDPNTSARGSLMMLPGLPLTLAFFGLARPDAIWMRVLSILPPTSPTLLTLRLTLTEVPWWEIALALVLLAVSIWLLRRAAGKVFALGILMYGKEPTWGETMRWIRET
ncbi:MAG: ABC transporter permease [Thermoanaerobaculia bacterium]|nr:ABC transporter permease [Thermoanaerobaculia bacterium]